MFQDNQYFSLANLTKPSLNKNIDKGSITEVIKTYILKSNLCPWINAGFLRYF